MEKEGPTSGAEAAIAGLPDHYDIVVIGGSAGGVDALIRLVGSPPSHFSAAPRWRPGRASSPIARGGDVRQAIMLMEAEPDEA